MLDYKLEHILSYQCTLVASPEVIGPLPEGIRVNFYTEHGEITGPRVRGKVRPVGGDWVTVRKDGVGLLDVRATFETHDGALMLVTYPGIVDFGADGYERFLRGEMPPMVSLRTSPRFATVDSAYLWINRLHCLGIGEYRSATNEVTYDVYAIL
jgi:hypothetical protein